MFNNSGMMISSGRDIWTNFVDKFQCRLDWQNMTTSHSNDDLSDPEFQDEGMNLTLDESFMDLAVLISYPRKRKCFLQRCNHFRKWRDDQFLARFRFSKHTVRFILSKIRNRISSRTNRNNAVSPEDKLLLTLRYYATGSFQAVSGDFIGVHKSTASQIIRLVSREIAQLRPEFVNFPGTTAERNFVRQEFYKIAKFPKCIGAIDCTHVRIKSPGGDNAEVYRNRKGYFSMNVQLVCDAHLRIQNVVCRWPGSSHDSTIFNHSVLRREFEGGDYGDDLLVGDSGYALKKYLMTPFLTPASRIEELYNESQIRTRNTIERTNGVWKRRFPVLALGISVKYETVESIIVATTVLHNIVRHFGDQLPRTSRTLEKYIQLTNFANGGPVLPGSSEGKIKRDTLVRYFEDLYNGST